MLKKLMDARVKLCTIKISMTAFTLYAITEVQLNHKWLGSEYLATYLIIRVTDIHLVCRF